MPIYRTVVSIRCLDHIDPADVAMHVYDAVQNWGGQFNGNPEEPFYPLAPREIAVRATCRGMRMDSDNYESFFDDAAGD